MLSLEDVLTKLRRNKAELSRRFHLKYLGVFGSFSQGQQTVNSDIDILVDFNRPVGIEFIDLADELENLLGRKVDLVSRKGIKPKYFNFIKEDILYV